MELPAEGIGRKPHTAVEYDSDGSRSSSSGHGFWGGRQLGTTLGEVGDSAVRPGRRGREGAGGPRRVDGEALRLSIFVERAAPDDELDTERTDVPSMLDRLFGWSTK